MRKHRAEQYEPRPDQSNQQADHVVACAKVRFEFLHVQLGTRFLRGADDHGRDVLAQRATNRASTWLFFKTRAHIEPLRPSSGLGTSRNSSALRARRTKIGGVLYPGIVG